MEASVGLNQAMESYISREEWLDVNSLRDGCRLFMALLSSWLEI